MGRFDRLPGIDEENTTRRNVLVGSGYVIGGFVVVGAIAGGGDDEPGNGEATPTPDGTPTPGYTPTPDETPTHDDTPTPVEHESGPLVSLQTVNIEEWDPSYEVFSGNGQRVTDEFNLASVATAALFEHDGNSNFIVRLLDDTGDSAELVINEIGYIDGARAFPTERGDYRLEINADGSWEITLFQPLAPDEYVYTTPTEASGVGYDVFGVAKLEGNHVVTGSHDGDSNFIVELIDEDASGAFGDTDLVFNEIGEFQGETHTNFEGYALLAVRADGNWSIEID